MDRRSFLLAAGVTGAAAASGAGFWRWLEFPTEVRSPGRQLGHLLRDRQAIPPPRAHYRTDVVILGWGAAGLTAAWRLAKSVLRRFMVVGGPEPRGNLASGIAGERALSDRRALPAAALARIDPHSRDARGPRHHPRRRSNRAALLRRTPCRSCARIAPADRRRLARRRATGERATGGRERRTSAFLQRRSTNWRWRAAATASALSRCRSPRRRPTRNGARSTR